MEVTVTAGPAAALLAVYAICAGFLVYNAVVYTSMRLVCLQLFVYVAGEPDEEPCGNGGAASLRRGTPAVSCLADWCLL
jgi:hypothetical protein